MSSVKIENEIADTTETPCECDSCDWKGPASATLPIDRIGERLLPGDITPVGECPECGVLTYYIDADAPEHSSQRRLYAYELADKNFTRDPSLEARAEDAAQKKLKNLYATMEAMAESAMGWLPEDEAMDFHRAAEIIKNIAEKTR